MSSKDLVLAAVANKVTERTPWVPFVGCHAAKLVGVRADEYFRNADHIYDGVKKAVELYEPDGIPVLFDLQLEAEALGCDLQWTDNNPPSVNKHILNDLSEVSSLDLPSKKSGRFPTVLDAMDRLKSDIGDEVALYGLVTGPFTLALHLRGSQIFIDMFDDPEGVKNLLKFCMKTALVVADMYIEKGMDIISLVDPMTSQISPKHFREFVSPYCSKIFEHIRRKEILSSFFVCGYAQKNIEEMCRCGPDNISIDENIDLSYVAETARRFGISFGGNIELTTVMLFGTVYDNIRSAQRCMDIGGNKGFILAPGCDIPFDVPFENIRAVTDLVRGRITIDEEVIRSEEVSEESIDIGDYENLDHIMIDVITLDSQACAPCTYMVETVKNAAMHFDGRVKWKEHKIKEKESLILMQALRVKHIPTIVIDGNIEYISITPSVAQLTEKLNEYMEDKFGL